MNLSFKSVFTQAIGLEILTFPYQISLATQNWPNTLKIETGMGKTAAIIFAWRFKRLQEDFDLGQSYPLALPPLMDFPT